MSPIDELTPIVLVGGRSRRFGRDKLREPLSDGAWLVDRPIAALRAVFGPRVALVGACDPSVAARGDASIVDLHPGVGPAGGILSALIARGDVFVLAGDMPSISAMTVRAIVDAARSATREPAVLAFTDRIEPCVGVYRRAAISALDRCVRDAARLADALPRDSVKLVSLGPHELVNANVPGDLR